MTTPYRCLPDLELRDAALTGSEGAWSELLRRYRGLIFRCIQKTIAKFENALVSEAAEEIFAEVCLNLLANDMRKLRYYDPAKGTKLGSWIGLIAVNTSYDHLRSVARRPMLDQIDGCPERRDTEPDPLECLLNKERALTLHKLSSEFSERDRCFIALYYRRELPAVEIAQAMDISLKTVYSKKNKIRKRLLEIHGEHREARAAA